MNYFRKRIFSKEVQNELEKGGEKLHGPGGQVGSGGRAWGELYGTRGSGRGFRYIVQTLDDVCY